jgi:hypothetical protein
MKIYLKISVILFLFWACSSNKNLVLKVVDEKSKEGIPEATIEISNYGKYKTDLDGKLILTKIASGKYHFSVSALGYKSIDSLEVNIRKSTNSINIALYYPEELYTKVDSIEIGYMTIIKNDTIYCIKVK